MRKIDIKKLTKKDIGKWVEYMGYAEGEKGRIKSWNDFNVFVVYKCGYDWDNFMNYTGVATNPKDLRYIKIKYKVNKNCKCSCHPNKTKGVIACTECMNYSHKKLKYEFA